MGGCNMAVRITSSATALGERVSSRVGNMVNETDKNRVGRSEV